jgi:predicted amidohydrolase
MRPFKLAMVQMLVEGGQKAANLRRAVQRIHEAAEGGANVVLLPEALTLGWTHASAGTQSEAIPAGESCQRLAQAAGESSVFVCAGLIERSGDRVFNAAVLIDPSGTVILHHRKLNELDIASGLYALGDRLGVAETPLGRIGLMICSDAFASGHVISRALGVMGARLILSPCAWAVPADHDNVREPYGQLWRDSYGPVAREFKIWIAGASNVGPIDSGPWAGRKCIGCSLLVGPDGQPALMGPYGENAEAILYADVTLEAPRRPNKA